jgi:hypothetical protein
MLSRIDETYAGAEIREVSEERARLVKLFNHPKFFNRKTQIIAKLRNKPHSSREPTKAQNRFLNILKRLFKPGTDPHTGEPDLNTYDYDPKNADVVSGYRKITRKELMKVSGLTEQQLRGFMQLGTTSGIIEKRVGKFTNLHGQWESTLRIRLNINKLESFVFGKNEDPGDLVVPEIKAKKSKKKTAAKIVQPMCEKTHSLPVYSEPVLQQPGEEVFSAESNCANKLNEGEKIAKQVENNGPTTNLDIAASPAASKISVETGSTPYHSEPGDGTALFQTSIPVHAAVQALLKLYPACDLTEDILKDLHFWVHKCSNPGLRLTPDRAATFIKYHNNNHMLPLMDRRDVKKGGQGPGNGHLDCTLPYLAKNWGKVWTWLRAQIHAHKLYDADWRLRELSSPAEDLAMREHMLLSLYQGACRRDVNTDLGEFLDTGTLLNFGEGTPAIDRLYVMWRAGLNLPGLVAKYADRLVDDLINDPHLVHELRGQGVPVDAWIKQSSKPRPNFYSLVQQNLAKAYAHQALGALYGSYELPAAKNQSISCPKYFSHL